MIGIDEPFIIDGQTYRLAPLSAAQAAELQVWVKAHLPDPIERARDVARDLPASESVMILQESIDAVCEGFGLLGTPEADAVLASPEGFTEQLFHAGRRHHPGMTRDDWRALVDHLVAEATATPDLEPESHTD